MELSLAYGNFLFTWPTTSCADDERLGFLGFETSAMHRGVALRTSKP